MKQANNRSEHQPMRGPVSHPTPSEAELARTCGKTIALVLATDFGTTPLKVAFEDEDKKPVVCEKPKDDEEKTPRPLQRFDGTTATSIAAMRALEARFARVYVLAGGTPEERYALEDEASGDITAARSSNSAPRQADRGVEFIPFDANTAYQATLDACGFTLYDIPKGTLDYATKALRDNPDADSVMLLSCDQVRITPAHLLEICRAFRENPTRDVIASWIQWYRLTPMLISRSFLEGLNASGLCDPGPNGVDRPLPRINLKDVVFGEEKLAPNAIVPDKLAAFQKDLTLSAREAVQIARKKIETEQGNPQTEGVEGVKGEGGLGDLHKASSAAKRGLSERLKAPEASPAPRPKSPSAPPPMKSFLKSRTTWLRAWMPGARSFPGKSASVSPGQTPGHGATARTSRCSTTASRRTHSPTWTPLPRRSAASARFRRRPTSTSTRTRTCTAGATNFPPMPQSI